MTPAKAKVAKVPTAAILELFVIDTISQQVDALPSIAASGSKMMNSEEADRPNALPTEPSTSGGKYWIENSDSASGLVERSSRPTIGSVLRGRPSKTAFV